MRPSQSLLREYVCAAETAEIDAAYARTEHRDTAAATYRLLRAVVEHHESVCRTYIRHLYDLGEISASDLADAWELICNLRRDAEKMRRTFMRHYGCSPDAIPKDTPWKE